MVLLKCCINMSANMENSAVATRLEKVSFHSNLKEGHCQRMYGLPYNFTHFTCQQVMLKILQARLQQYVDQELPDVQAGFTKGQISNCQHSLNHKEIKGIPEKKKSTSASLTTLKLVWIIINCGKFFKRWEYQTTLPPS